MKANLAALAAIVFATATGMRVRAANRTPVETGPFRVSADSLQARFSRVAVGHVSTVGTLVVPSPDDSTRFAPLILDMLVGAGYEVVPPESVLARWRFEVAAGGGIYDTRKGTRDEVRTRAALARTALWLRDSLGARLWLHYETVTSTAQYADNRAQWDGASRDIGAPGLVNLLLTGPTSGTIPGYSVEVAIEECGGAVLYSRRGGLMPAERLVKDRWVPTPYRERLGTPWESESALRRALSPWIELVRAAPRTTR